MRKNKQSQRCSVIGAGFVALDVVRIEETTIHQAGGTCGNVLALLAHFGWTSKVVARLASDIASDRVVGDLQRSGVDVTWLERDLRDAPTIVQINKSDGTHRFKLDCPDCGRYFRRFQSPTLDQIGDASAQLSAGAPNVFFTDRVSPATLRLAEAAARGNVPVWFEPGRSAVRAEEMLTRCDIVKYAHGALGEGDMGARAQVAREDWPLIEIETLGAEGVRFRTKRMQSWRHLDATPIRRLRDTSGAGDATSAAFLHKIAPMLVNGWRQRLTAEVVFDSLHWAQQVAALACEYVGARGIVDNVPFAQLPRALKGRLDSQAAFPSFPRQSAICPTCLGSRGRRANTSKRKTCSEKSTSA